jgi:hypothetical protein
MAALRLHQVLALEKGAKSQTESEVTKAYQDAQRVALFNGLTRVYTPRDEEGERLPSERKIVQSTAALIIKRATDAWSRQADLVITKDAANQTARADIVVDGERIAENVPVTTLLYLEKTLQNVRELVRKLPVLDPEVEWGNAPDAATGLWKSSAEETVRTKKVPKAFVKAWPTADHPNIVPQVDTYTEDNIVGTWSKTLFSGALPARHKLDLITRIEHLADAVKVARETANQAEAADRQIGSAVFGHLFAPVNG